ncbi:MAG TPA: prepilin-type N-terminal cleavage/methylation domain-containing protein [Bacillota bacterium]|nr:prepilin-type N-terminal cleavage/methylation domain-containing protein [Bacillota bacterium]
MLMNLLRKMRDQKGFTLIELIFVVIILAVLSGVALINLGGSEEDAKIAVAKADLRTIATAVKVYKAKTNAYPTNLDALVTASGSYKPMLDEKLKDPNGNFYNVVSSNNSTTITATNISGASINVK